MLASSLYVSEASAAIAVSCEFDGTLVGIITRVTDCPSCQEMRPERFPPNSQPSEGNAHPGLRLSDLGDPADSLPPDEQFLNLLRAAEQKCDSGGPLLDLVKLKVMGEIEVSDAIVLERFASLSAETGPQRFGNIVIMGSVYFDSAGGDAYAAMRIGDALFKQRATAFVIGPCFSACVLAVAGATSRIYANYAEVGVHRVYAIDADAISIGNAAELHSRYARRFESIQTYLQKYSVSDRLLDMFKTIPSKDMRIISKEELSDLGAGLQNLAYEELKRHTIEKNCGMDVYERYVSEERKIAAICKGFWDEIRSPCDLQIRRSVKEKLRIEDKCM